MPKGLRKTRDISICPGLFSNLKKMSYTYYWPVMWVSVYFGKLAQLEVTNLHQNLYMNISMYHFHQCGSIHFHLSWLENPQYYNPRRNKTFASAISVLVIRVRSRHVIDQSPNLVATNNTVTKSSLDKNQTFYELSAFIT